MSKSQQGLFDGCTSLAWITDSGLVPRCSNALTVKLHGLGARCGHGRWPVVLLAPRQPARAWLAVAALQSPGDLQPSPVAEADRALQSLLESGIRGSLAGVFAYALHVNLLDGLHWSGHDALLGLQLAAPVVALDALLLLPDAGAIAAAGAAAATTRGGRFLQLAGEALALLQAEASRYALAGTATPAQRAALAGAAQLSEELLSRGVILGFAALWTTSRRTGGWLEEAGLADVSLAPDSPELADVLRWALAAAIVAATAARYSHHAASKVSTMRAERAAATADAASRAALLRFEAASSQADRRAKLARRIAAAEGRCGPAAEALELGAALLLGGRFVLGAGAAYAAFLATDNLLASFCAGLALQLAGGAMSAAGGAGQRVRRGSSDGAGTGAGGGDE